MLCDETSLSSDTAVLSYLLSYPKGISPLASSSPVFPPSLACSPKKPTRKRGTILGTLIGAFLIAVIRNGAVLLNIDIFTQSVIIGVIIWLSVIWDQFRRRQFGKQN